MPLILSFNHVFYFGNFLISWQSRLQTTVALSSTEAEYMVISSTTQELLWLKQLLIDLHISVDTPTIYSDNMGAKSLAYNPTHHRRTKHINIRVHFVRDHIAEGNLIILHVPTEENPSNLMTKAVKRSTFQHLSPKLTQIAYPPS